MAGSPKEVVLVRKLTGLGIVDHEDINVLEGFTKFGVGPLDPIVHGIHGGDPRSAADLAENVALKIGGDVGEENVFGVAVSVRKAGLKFGKDIQVGGESDSLVEVFGIASGPEKALAAGAFEALDVNRPFPENRFVPGMEVVADDSDKVHVSEKCSRNGKICSGATQRAFDLPERAFQRIISNRTDH
jgi:hypothetical protein